VRGRDYLLLLLLAALWGLSFVFYRVGSPAVGPVLFVELRVGIAGLVVAGYLLATGGLRDSMGRIRPRIARIVLLGGLNAAFPFCMFAIAELVLSAAYASILNSTTPLFTLALGVGILGQSFSIRHAVGVGLGIGGVAVLVGTSPFPVTFVVLGSMVLILFAALAYAISALLVSRWLKGLQPIDLSLGQQLSAAALLLPLAIPEIPAAHFTLQASTAILGIALLSTVLAFAIYFRLLQEVGPRPATTVTMLMPIFGVFWGWLLLGETIGVGVVAGVAMVALGVALLTDLAFHRLITWRFRRAPSG
jgi:drug/metabolite transporter (DMT)-like permease